MGESEKNSTHAATWAEGGDGNSDRQGANSLSNSITDGLEIQDHFAYLLNVGIPLDVVQKYQQEGLSCEELAAAVKSMLERGRTIAEIIGEETGEPPEAQPPPTPSLSTVNAADLQKMEIPPVRWVVKDLFPAGLNLIASPPKYGKSWMVLDLCLAVAAGGRFLSYQTNKADCLYLALEDSLRRIKSRMGKLLAGKEAPAGFHVTISARSLDDGLLDELEVFLKDHADVALIVIDTLQRVRGTANGREGVYANDYRELAALKEFADRHNVALLLVHHLRKMQDTADPFNMISGSNGVMGAVDTAVVLTRESRDADTTNMSAVGRDIEGNDIVLQFNKSTCRWESLGNADAFEEQQAHAEYMNNPIVKTVKKLLEQMPDGWSGTAQQLMEAGRFIVHTTLADSTQALTNKLKALDGPLLEHDNIVHERKKNGSGGGRHKFYFANAPQFEEVELEQEEFDPFDEL